MFQPGSGTVHHMLRMRAVFNGGFLWLFRESRLHSWLSASSVRFLPEENRLGSNSKQGSQSPRVSLLRKITKRKVSGSLRSCMLLDRMMNGLLRSSMRLSRLFWLRRLSSCVAGVSCSRFHSGGTVSCMESWFRCLPSLPVSVSIPLGFGFCFPY